MQTKNVPIYYIKTVLPTFGKVKWLVLVFIVLLSALVDGDVVFLHPGQIAITSIEYLIVHRVLTLPSNTTNS